MKYINLNIPEHSYFFGFVQADGSFRKSSRNRGKLEIELGEKDKHILYSFKATFPSVYSVVKIRTRDTNFKKGYKSFVFGLYNWDFRKEINRLGLPHGRKSEIISPPKGNFIERDYLRGLLDGDGSVGVTTKDLPFVNFTIKSEVLKEYLVDVIEKIVGEKKNIRRNKRDNIYNIMINREKAQKFIKYLYYPGCLCLNRKLKMAGGAIKWKRPKNMKRVLQKKYWKKWEDEYIKNHSIIKSCNYLNRTKSSINMRLWRIKNNTYHYLHA